MSCFLGQDNGPIAPKNLQTMQARLQRRVIFMAVSPALCSGSTGGIVIARGTANPESVAGSSKPDREERAPLRLGLLLLQDPEQESARPDSSPPSFHS